MMRAWMINMRERRGWTREMAAWKCKCTPLLLQKVEDDESITHPHIAARIANAYGMSVGQYNRLVHSSHKAKVLPEVRPLPTSVDWRDFCRKIKHEKAGD